MKSDHAPTYATASNRSLTIWLISTLTVVGAFSLACMSDMDERPAESYDIVTDDQLDIFEEAGVDIHLGSDPPQAVVATWFLDNMVITSDADPIMVGSPRSDVEITFSDLSGGDVYVAWHHPASSAGSTGQGAFISGGNGCFTVYADSSGHSVNCNYTAIELFSGCISGNTMESGFQQAIMLTHKSGSDCQNVMDIETPRVVENQSPAYRR